MNFLKNLTSKHWILISIIASIIVIAIAAISLILIKTGKQADGEQIDNEQSYGIITMTTNDNEVNIELMGSGTVIFDWGDGSEKETTELVYDDEGVFWNSRKYSNTSFRTITITGENITGLNCSYQKLTKLDVSQNTALTKLNCEGNQLTELNVSQNTALTYLSCHDNPLTALDVSQNTALTYLSCNNNKLTALDISQNTVLTNLACTVNQLTTLDVSKNTMLEFLYCHQNKLTALDVSKNTALQELYCGDNQLTADALNNLFGTLHDKDFAKVIGIGNNPGSADCDPSIAEAKGWAVEGFTGTQINDLISISKVQGDISGEHHFFSDSAQGTSEKIMFRVKERVENFAYIEILHSLGDTDNIALLAGERLFGLDELTPEKPLVTATYIGSTIPSRGISFTYKGKINYFYITESGMDGSTLLVRFTPPR